MSVRHISQKGSARFGHRVSGTAVSILAIGLILVSISAPISVGALETKSSDNTTDVPVKPTTPSMIGKSPKLKLPLINGKTFDLSKWRGQWVVVNFWATWCSPCLKEMPDFDALDRSRKDVSVVGLAFEEIERAEMLAFLKDHPVQYPIAIVDTFNPPKDFEVPRGLPTTYLIDPSGKIANRFLGPITGKQIEEAILKAQNSKAGAATRQSPVKVTTIDFTGDTPAMTKSTTPPRAQIAGSALNAFAPLTLQSVP